jgi:hypothetical protein
VPFHRRFPAVAERHEPNHHQSEDEHTGRAAHVFCLTSARFGPKVPRSEDRSEFARKVWPVHGNVPATQFVPTLGTTTADDPLIIRLRLFRDVQVVASTVGHFAQAKSGRVAREPKQAEGKNVAIQDGRRTRQRDSSDRTS